MPQHAVAISGSVGSGVLGWLVRHLLSQPSLEACQPWLNTALEPLQHCDCPDLSSSVDWDRIITALSADKIYFLIGGIILGFGGSLCIDILYVFKEAWRRQVLRWISPKPIRVRGEPLIAVGYGRPGYSSH